MTRTWLGLGLLCCLAACKDDPDPASCATDGGSSLGASAGTHADAGERDAGHLVWHPPDAGTIEDPPIVAPQDAGSAATCAMRRSPLPSALLPRCEVGTGQCMAGCATATDPDSCRDACLASDHHPAESMYGLDCKGCIYLQLFACIDQAGCHDAVADVFCCLADKCPAGSPESCGEQKCGDQLMTALTCGYFANMECTDFSKGMIAQCYGGDVDADAGI